MESSPKAPRSESDEGDHTKDLEHNHKITRANFRDDGNFPPFTFLPDENDIDLDFYTSPDGFQYFPQKHWCFLAEILSVESLLRVRVVAQDKIGTKVPIAFYTEDHGMGFVSKLQVGHTVAVLYALQHGFLDLTTGIRVEDSNTVKILPISLGDLFRLSDRVQQYSAESDGERTCHGCDKRKSSLQKCAKCTLFWYCNKTCQTDGWGTKDHKRDCKILRDNDFRAMLYSQWNDFKEYFTFPM